MLKDGEEGKVLDKDSFFKNLDIINSALNSFLCDLYISKTSSPNIKFVTFEQISETIKSDKIKKLLTCYFEALENTNQILIDELHIYHQHRDELFNQLRGNAYFEAYISILDAWIYKN